MDVNDRLGIRRQIVRHHNLPPGVMEWIESALRRVYNKVDRTLEQLGNRFPHVSCGTEWVVSPVTGWQETHGDWTAGFWPGILWLVYEARGEPRYRHAALRYCELLEPRLTYDSHDLGFLFYPSCVKGYELTGDERLRDWALRAADGLLKLYNPRARLFSLRGHGSLRDYAAVDTMMNLPLLWWAYRETGERHYFEVALDHARTSVRYFIRRNGSTYHVLCFSPETSEVIWRGTRQGLSNSSCWSRGQAWMLTGCIMALLETGDRTMARAVDLLYQYVADHLPDDYVPYWDFDVDDESLNWRDSSAAAIMASGLLRLSGQPDRGPSRLGLNILRSLFENYSVAERAREPSLLRHGCFHAPEKIAVDNGLIWGDYFYLEALVRAQRILARTNAKTEIGNEDTQASE